MEISISEAKDWFRYHIDETRREEILNELGLSEPNWEMIRDSFYYEIEAYVNENHIDFPAIEENAAIQEAEEKELNSL